MKLRKYDPKRKPAKCSLAQKWAQERNWNKANLTGIAGNIHRIATYNNSTTLEERTNLVEAYKKIMVVLNTWNDNNKESKARFMFYRDLQTKEVKKSEADN